MEDKGDKGEKGDAGAQGPAGVAALQIVMTQSTTKTSFYKNAIAFCPSGKRAIAGGASVSSTGVNGPFVTSSAPTENPRGWSGGANEGAAFPSAVSWYLMVYAVCATVAG